MAISGLDSRDGGKESLLLSPHLPIPPSPTTQSRASPRTKIPSSGQYFLETVTTTPCLLYGNREKSLHHVAKVAKFLDLNQSGYCKYSRKKNVYDFPVHDCTKEQNSGPYFSSIVQQCKWPSLSRRIVGIQKFCHHGNVTSCFSFLLG